MSEEVEQVNPDPHPPQEEPQQESFMWRVAKMVLVYFLIMQVVSLFKGQKQFNKEDLLDQDGHQVLLKDKLQNLFYTSHEFNVTGYVSPHKYFVKNKKTQEYQVNQKMKKVFEKEGLTYDWESTNEISYNISFPISQKFLDRNATMYLHVEFEADYRFKDDHLDLEMPEYRSIPGYSDAWFKDGGNKIVMHRSIPLIKYTPKVEEKKTVNLLNGDIEVKEEPKEEDEGPKPYIQHLKPEIY